MNKSVWNFAGTVPFVWDSQGSLVGSPVARLPLSTCPAQTHISLPPVGLWNLHPALLLT